MVAMTYHRSHVMTMTIITAVKTRTRVPSRPGARSPPEARASEDHRTP